MEKIGQAGEVKEKKMKKKLLTIAIMLLFIGTVLLPVCNAFSQPGNPTSGIEEQPDEQNDLKEDEQESPEPECLWAYGPYLKATVKGTVGRYNEGLTIFGYSFNIKCKLYSEKENELWIYPLRGKEIHIVPTPTDDGWYFGARVAKWDVFEEIVPHEEYYIEGTVIWCIADGSPE